jgi:hypothetical protein
MNSYQLLPQCLPPALYPDPRHPNRDDTDYDDDGKYDEAFPLRMASAYRNAEIRYSLDDSPVNENSSIRYLTFTELPKRFLEFWIRLRMEIVRQLIQAGISRARCRC